MKNIEHIPFYGIKRFYERNSKDVLNTINAVYSSGSLMMGPEVESFENKIGLLCGRKYGIAVGSCTDALYFALLSAGVEAGDEVLITSFSYVASVSPILRVGAIPVFVDIDPKSYMMDLADLKSKITPKTKAVICVHLLGQMLPLEELEGITTAHDLTLIEDTAQALGSEQNGIPAGSLGISSCFSFDPTKVIGAFGNGGVVLTDSKSVYAEIRRLRYHGKDDVTGDFEILGYNSRMATAQAALLVFQLDNLDDLLKRRIAIAKIYRHELSGVREITLPEVSPGNTHTFHKYVIQVELRDELKQHLATNGIQTMTHYRTALFEHPLLNHHIYRAENISVTHLIKNKVLSLPLYPELQDDEVGYICNSIKTFYGKSS